MVRKSQVVKGRNDVHFLAARHDFIPLPSLLTTFTLNLCEHC